MASVVKEKSPGAENVNSLANLLSQMNTDDIHNDSTQQTNGADFSSVNSKVGLHFTGVS